MSRNTLINHEQISARVTQLAAEIEATNPHVHSEEGLLLIAILKGGAPFAIDLQRALYADHGLDTEIEYVAISSYGDEQESSGEPILITDRDFLARKVKGRDILVVEDILETGLTLKMFLEVLAEMGANSISTAVLLSKLVERLEDIKIDYVGFEIDDKWVDGYGIDTAHRGRGNPNIDEVIPDLDSSESLKTLDSATTSHSS